MFEVGGGIGVKERRKKKKRVREKIYLRTTVVDIFVPAPLETVTDFCGVPFDIILVLVTYLLPVGLVIEVTGILVEKNAKERMMKMMSTGCFRPSIEMNLYACDFDQGRLPLTNLLGDVEAIEFQA